MECFLSKRERGQLHIRYRSERERRYPDRIKGLLLWDEGWTFDQISHVLLLD